MRHTIFALCLVTLACDDEPVVRPAAREAATPAEAADPHATEVFRERDPHAQNPHANPHAQNPHAQQNPSGALGPEAVGGVTWHAPEPFRRIQPSSQMRAAEYVYPEQQGEAAATLTVFYFGTGQGGSIEDNVERWLSQLVQPDGSPTRDRARIEETEVNGMRVTTVDATGTYQASPMMGGTGAPQQNQRMLGAIVVGPQGPVFFKMVGDASLMERANEQFTALIQSFEAG
jgi:hypothetical protein